MHAITPRHTRSLLLAALAAGLMLLAPAGASAQTAVPASFTPAGAGFLPLNVNQVENPASQFDGSTDPSDPCGVNGPRSDRSFWFRVRGTGGRLTFTTNFAGALDTILYVFTPGNTPPGGAAFCDDDVNFPSNRSSELTIENSVAGGTYFVSFGICRLNDFSAFCTPASSDGVVNYAVLSNDQRQFADTFVNEARTNVGATVEPGEAPSCNGVAYGATVWYRYTAPAKGRVVLGVNSAADTVMSVYRGDSATAAGCNVDSPTNPLRSEVALDVAAGEPLLVEIGTTNGIGGGLSLSANFVEDLDLDDDGFNRDVDCNDANAAINPGRPDIPNNGIDEDCRNGDNTDGDGDGVPRAQDCNDANPAISPKANEVPGNSVDENCDGRAAAGRLDPQPQITFSSVPSRGGRRFGVMTISDVKKGYRVVVRCKATRSCPPRRVYTKTARSGKRLRFTAFFGRTLRRPGRVEISITLPRSNTLGVFRRYSVTTRSRVRRTNCTLQPGSAKPTSCRPG